MCKMAARSVLVSVAIGTLLLDGAGFRVAARGKNYDPSLLTSQF